MKATPEDVAKTKAAEAAGASNPAASMKATPEDVAKPSTWPTSARRSRKSLNEGHARRRGEDADRNDG